MMPYDFGDLGWRVRLWALVLSASSQVSICFVVIAAIALFAERYTAVRIAAVAAIVFGLVLIPVLIADGLDVLQFQLSVPLDKMRQYRINVLQTWITAALMVPALLWMGRRGLTAGKGEPRVDIVDAILIDREPLPGPHDPRVNN